MNPCSSDQGSGKQEAGGWGLEAGGRRQGHWVSKIFKKSSVYIS
jgi:hypothetical protein